MSRTGSRAAGVEVLMDGAGGALPCVARAPGGQ